jgi:hypothetical protein
MFIGKLIMSQSSCHRRSKTEPVLFPYTPFNSPNRCITINEHKNRKPSPPYPIQPYIPSSPLSPPKKGNKYKNLRVKIRRKKIENFYIQRYMPNRHRVINSEDENSYIKGTRWRCTKCKRIFRNFVNVYNHFFCKEVIPNTVTSSSCKSV